LLVSGQPKVQQALALAFQKQDLDLSSSRVLHKPAGEPTAASVSSAAAWLADNPFETLIAVGGGSVLDWARLALAASKGWLEPDKGDIRPAVRSSDRPALILVPTTCGSGAEAAAVAVYALDGRKVAVVSDAFLADRVILDAQFLATAPAAVLASWMSDTLSHAVEAFVSIVPNALAKQAAVGALTMVLQHHAAADLHGRRERLMEAGYLGGVAASNCSVGVIHAFAHSVASYGVPHGVANALGIAAGIAANSDTSEMRGLLDRMRFASAKALTEAIAPITSMALSAGVPERTRAALGNHSEREAIAARMTTDVCLRTNPRRLDREGLMAFLADVGQVVPRV
jgi:alcohol dehydrogenase class IV